MFCKICGKSNDEAARFCRSCGSTLQAASPDIGLSDSRLRPVAPETTRFAVGKKPLVALVFAIVPGLGQFYNGDFKKGLLVLFLAVVALLLAPETYCSSLFPFFAIWVWGFVNAYSVAAGKTPLWT